MRLISIGAHVDIADLIKVTTFFGVRTAELLVEFAEARAHAIRICMWIAIGLHLASLNAKASTAEAWGVARMLPLRCRVRPAALAQSLTRLIHVLGSKLRWSSRRQSKFTYILLVVVLCVPKPGIRVALVLASLGILVGHLTSFLTHFSFITKI